MSDAAALKAEANAAFSAKDFVKANELYSKAIELDPSNHVLYSNRSATKTSLKDYAGALEDAERCIQIDSSFVKGHARKGAALHGLGDLEDAVFAYEEGLKIDPNNAPLKKGLDDVKRALDSRGPPGGDDAGLGAFFKDPNLLGKLASNPKTAAHMRDPGFVAKVQGLAQGGNVDFASMLQDKRMLDVIGVAMGIDMQAFERPEGSTEMPEGSGIKEPAATPMEGVEPTSSSTSKAAKVEDDVPEPKPTPRAPEPKKTAPTPAKEAAPEPAADAEEKKQALAAKARGAEAYKSRDFDAAIQAFTEAWETWPQDVTFLTNLAAVYFEKGDYPKSIETCEKAVEEGRSLRADYKVIAKALGRIGSAYEKQADLANAIKYYSKSLTEHRTADILTKLRAAEKAKAEAEKQAYINPELAEKEREEGNVHFKAGTFAEAVKHYTEAIKRLPSDPRAYNNRAAAYTKLAAFPEALKDAEEAIRIDPTFIKAYIRKSMVLFGMKDYAKALNACQEAMEADTEKKHTREIEQQMQKCMMETYAQRSTETDEQTLARAMQDPEVAKIMSDPAMQSMLQTAQSDPRALQEYMKNPVVKAKIQKLVAAGIIKTR
ncbi:hypothetical protein QFC22_006454 [Naganishia vaughanmartiniae]|uniref:Uncharacterized protein n=1 Tax=Naganishia vaughanmartiniae TaxID=1424756 RepID=A0ACC2WKS9_9TREE|nr:hypothetical protein QFC22_006454 [Naganishia vaughanmartiniae]